jgi:hypothetical protein
MTISIKGLPIHNAELHAPNAQSWTLDIAYTGEALPSGLVTVLWGNATFVGTVDPLHVGVFNTEIRCKIVGGYGWSTELPATWYQSDSPGVHGKTIATKAAEVVGETLVDASADTYRPLRVSYSRSKRTAGESLTDSLAPGNRWWVDFGGATRVGVRPAPSIPARVALLDYDPASKWAELDADDPSNLIGATIPADPVRGFPALVIIELFAWGNDDGFRYRAGVALAPEQGNSRLVEAMRVLTRALIPELPTLQLRRARITSQSNDGRVSLQQVERDGVISDFGALDGAVRLYAGTPGVSAEMDLRGGLTPETILAFCRADQSDPIAFLSPPVDQPGHVPFRTYHEADNTIRFVGLSNGVVRVGASPTVPVALAPEVAAAFDLVTAALAAVATYATAVGVALPPAAPAAATLSAALITPVTGILALLNAKDATYPVGYTATRLEAT